MFKYDVFLSFASEDNDLVIPIWKELCQSGLRVFWASTSLRTKAGQSWYDIIESSVIDSRHFVLICTPNAMKSEWVKVEYQTFYDQCYLEHHDERRFILKLEENFDINSLPPFLKRIQATSSFKDIKHAVTLLNEGSEIQRLRTALEETQQKLKDLESENKNLHKELLKVKLDLSDLKTGLEENEILNNPDLLEIVKLKEQGQNFLRKVLNRMTRIATIAGEKEAAAREESEKCFKKPDLKSLMNLYNKATRDVELENIFMDTYNPIRLGISSTKDYIDSKKEIKLENRSDGEYLAIEASPNNRYYIVPGFHLDYKKKYPYKIDLLFICNYDPQSKGHHVKLVKPAIFTKKHEQYEYSSKGTIQLGFKLNLKPELKKS